jgi:hypothetical protein
MAELLMQEEGSTPSTPSAGKWKIYPKSTGLYVLEDTGREVGPLNRFIQTGTEAITCTSGVASVSATITFPVAFLAAPLVFFSPGPSGNFTTAEMPVIVRGDTLSTTQVSVFVRTTDGGNWAADRTLNLQWIAIGT